MEFLAELWLPILLSSIVVWIASAIVWTAMPHRKAEWSAVPDEASFVATIRSSEVSAGYYMFPHWTKEKSSDQQFQEVWKEGPHGVLHVWQKRRSMPMCMLGSFIFYLVVGAFVAYIGAEAMNPGERYLRVFQITGTVAFMAHAFAVIPGGIWFGKPVLSMVYDVVEGLVYGLLTGGVFGWLWPAAPTAADAIQGM